LTILTLILERPSSLDSNLSTHSPTHLFNPLAMSDVKATKTASKKAAAPKKEKAAATKSRLLFVTLPVSILIISTYRGRREGD